MTESAPSAARLSGIARVSDFVALQAQRTPHAEAMVLDDRRITYAEMHKQVEATARALVAAGVRKGDRVATLTSPHPEYFITFLASASIGAIWMGLNPRYRTEELKYAVGDAEPSLLFARTSIGGRSYLEEIAAMRAAAPSIRTVVALDGDASEDGIQGLAAFVASGHAVNDESLAAVRAQCGDRDPCLIVYTSGSTGKPKGAIQCHQAIVEFSLEQNRAWPVSGAPRFLNFLPINHIGCVVDLSCPTLAAGGCLVFMEQFTPDGAMALMQKERINVWGSVPSVFQMQMALPDFDSYDLSAVQMILWEGAAMPLPIIRRLREIVPRLATNYNMTEACAITIVRPTDDLDVLANTVGLPFTGVEVRLADGDGKVLAEGQPGEVQTRSIYNTLGYWRRPKETAESFTADGWFRTGDLAERRPDGRYRIVGRIKEMYKSGGYNVYPREVEDVIESHPAVELAAVVSRPDPLWQEVGIAYVLTRGPVTADELERHCRERLANYKLPKKFELCAELPLLPIGKVDKIALRRRAAESA
jgi:acyl-CoA synthetase (AMP-forming)/AMP-acid ligase II